MTQNILFYSAELHNKYRKMRMIFYVLNVYKEIHQKYGYNVLHVMITTPFFYSVGFQWTKV